MTMPPALLHALTESIRLLNTGEDIRNMKWLLGGGCGLLLQQVTNGVPPKDIDLYADRRAAGRLHRKLNRCGSEAPKEDFSGECRSLRSNYLIQGVQVDLSCGYEIRRPGAGYKTDARLLAAFASETWMGEAGPVKLMPLAHELVCNLLRGRQERCEAIAAVMRPELPAHLPLLRELVARNRIEGLYLGQLGELLGSTIKSA